MFCVSNEVEHLLIEYKHFVIKAMLFSRTDFMIIEDLPDSLRLHLNVS